MATNLEHAVRWVENRTGQTKLDLFSRGRSNVYAEGDRIYSYGSHFTMGIYTGQGFILNGDRYSPTTGQHQQRLRVAVKDHPHVIIPFSALRAAGVFPDEVEVVDSLPDRIVAVTRQGRLPRYVEEYRLLQHRLDLPPYTREFFKKWVESHDAVEVSPIGPEWRWTEHQHRLGECVFRANVSYEDGVTGERVRRHAYFISAWDNQDTDTYFLSELPHPVSSLDEAYEALKPETVKRAEFEGRQVVRQGDVFAVETSLSKRDLRKRGAEFARMSPVLGTNHVATEVATLPNGVQLARGVLWHKPQGRPSDHRRQKISGPEFWVCVKNTVPTEEGR